MAANENTLVELDITNDDKTAENTAVQDENLNHFNKINEKI